MGRIQIGEAGERANEEYSLDLAGGRANTSERSLTMACRGVCLCVCVIISSGPAARTYKMVAVAAGRLAQDFQSQTPERPQQEIGRPSRLTANMGQKPRA
jgi:hypothetical protein